MSAIAGRVLLIPKGNYDSTATYTMLDMVVYNGSSYICKQECTGVVPTNTTYWMLNASGSAVAFLNDIGDVVITTPANGQVLMYDSATQKWVNGTISTTLAGLSDTTISSPTNKQGLIYNGTSGKWENEDIEGLPDNTITYAQFIQMSDAEQLAFTGNVTDYPGIDDMPNADDVVFDNTGTDLVSNNVNDAIVEVNGKVNDIDDRISAYTLGTAIDLISYTSSSNPYVFQSDGYLSLEASVSSGTYIQVYISSKFKAIARYNASDTVDIYVRKGMNVYISAKGGSASLKFYPLS